MPARPRRRSAPCARPGHHALPARAMGFCLFNNVAVAAAALAGRGERVLVVDYDAHHGNGTQDDLLRRPAGRLRVVPPAPALPGHRGGARDRGGRGRRARTVNVPVPPGATGDVYRAAVDDVVVPLAEDVRATWLLVSAGFDAHRRDPLTDLGLTSGRLRRHHRRPVGAGASGPAAGVPRGRLRPGGPARLDRRRPRRTRRRSAAPRGADLGRAWSRGGGRGGGRAYEGVATPGRRPLTTAYPRAT